MQYNTHVWFGMPETRGGEMIPGHGIAVSEEGWERLHPLCTHCGDRRQPHYVEGAYKCASCGEPKSVPDHIIKERVAARRREERETSGCAKCGGSYILRETSHIRRCEGCGHVWALGGSEWAEAVADSCPCDACGNYTTVKMHCNTCGMPHAVHMRARRLHVHDYTQYCPNCRAMSVHSAAAGMPVRGGAA